MLNILDKIVELWCPQTGQGEMSETPALFPGGKVDEDLTLRVAYHVASVANRVTILNLLEGLLSILVTMGNFCRLLNIATKLELNP